MNRKKGFTLIELLVVISIIALLLAILLPSLNMAKEMARTVVCKAHMRNFGTGLATYTTTWNDWLPGPNTSGIQLNDGVYNFGDSSSAPTQNMDWISPILGNELQLPEERAERITAILNHELRCPSNAKKYDYVYAGISDVWESIVNTMYISSYTSPQAFHVYPTGYRDSKYRLVTDHETFAVTRVPGSYRPKLNRIGRPTQKAFVIEGSRYLDKQPDGNYLASFNGLTYQDEGGNFMVYGPPITFGGDPYKFENRSSPKIIDGTEKYSFRHSGQKFNMIFFDGHAETMHFKEALDINLYWPRGSEVIRSDATWDTNDTDNMTIK